MDRGAVDTSRGAGATVPGTPAPAPVTHVRDTASHATPAQAPAASPPAAQGGATEAGDAPGSSSVATCSSGSMPSLNGEQDVSDPSGTPGLKAASVPRRAVPSVQRASQHMTVNGERFLEVPAYPGLYHGVSGPPPHTRSPWSTLGRGARVAPRHTVRQMTCPGWNNACRMNQFVETDVTTVLRYTPSHVKYRSPPDRFCRPGCRIKCVHASAAAGATNVLIVPHW